MFPLPNALCPNIEYYFFDVLLIIPFESKD